MDAEQASKTLLNRGKPEQFTPDHARRILDYQKQTGFDDFADPDAVSDSPEAEATAQTDNADHGQPSHSVSIDTGERESDKTGAAGQ